MMPRSSLLARALLLLLLSVALVRPWAAWAAPPDIGQPAPDFTVQALDGTPFQLSTHQGRVVVLMFTAPSCGECVPELRALAQVHAEDASRGVDILALNVDPSTSTRDLVDFKASIGGADYAWAQDVGGQVALAYGAPALESTVIVDRDGRVAYRDENNTTLETYRSVLAPLLGSPKSPDTAIPPPSVAPGQ